MKTHVLAIKIVGIVGIIVLICSIIMNSMLSDKYWVGILQSIFGSATLVFTIELVSYFTSRRKILEDFFQLTNKILRKLNEYDINFSIDKKTEYYLKINDTDFILWEELGNAYSGIDFLIDYGDKNKKYIFNTIYKPLKAICSEIVKHSPNFRWHLDGSGHNDTAMLAYIDVIESMIIERIAQDINGTICTSVNIKIVKEMSEELHGRYYEIMYGKKKANSLRKEMSQSMRL